MFRNICFHVHDCVPYPDDVGAQLQDRGGRTCYNMHNADVIVIDGACCPLSDRCIQQRRLLPYNSQDSNQMSKRRTRSSQTNVAFDPVVATSIPATIQNITRTTKRATVPCEGPGGHVSQGKVNTSPPSTPLESNLVVPLPSSAARSFSAAVGKAGYHPPELKAYFTQFLIAAWTLHPSKSVHAISKALTRLLPRLSEHSLQHWLSRNREQYNDAKQQAEVARARGVMTGLGDLDNEIQRTLRALTVDRASSSQAQVKPRAGMSLRKRRPKPGVRRHRIIPRSAAKAHKPRLDPLSSKALLSAIVGTTDVASMLDMPGKPPLPKDLHPEAKAAYFDAMLKWVLEREPTATKSGISLLVYALGEDLFFERTFEQSFRSEPRSRRYHEIRNNVLGRWKSGELGTLDKDDAAALKRVNGRYLINGHRMFALPPTDLGEPEEAQGGNGDRAGSTESSVATAPPDDRDAFGHADEHRAPEDEFGNDEPCALQLENANGEIVDTVDDDELRDLARFSIWFEDFVARHIRKPEEREAKRAVIWTFMLHKHGHDEKYWQSLYKLRKTVVERYAAQLRVRTSSA